MRFTLGMLLGSMLLLTGCASKHMPVPVYGVDIVQVQKGTEAPFTGTLFSPFYLDNYLQWKDPK
jgi:uncharacterized lipoprotein YmbA